MKGTDVTPEQLAHAAQFAQQAQKGKKIPAVFSIRREELIRLLAWYAVIRTGNKKPLGILVSGSSSDLFKRAASFAKRYGFSSITVIAPDGKNKTFSAEAK